MKTWVAGAVRRGTHGHVVPAGGIVPGLRCRDPGLRLTIGAGATVEGAIQHAGAVTLGRGAQCHGGIRAGHELVVGADCSVGGAVDVEGQLTIQAGAVMGGPARAGGDVYLLGDCHVGDVDAGGDIVIVGNPSTGHLRPKGKVATRAW